MTAAKLNWSNLRTAPLLCRHMIDDAIALEEAGRGAGFIDGWHLAQEIGIVQDRRGFGDMIRSAYAKLYKSDATCIHTQQDGGESSDD